MYRIVQDGKGSPLARLHPASLVGNDKQLGAIAGVQFGQDATDVGLDGCLADKKVIGGSLKQRISRGAPLTMPRTPRSRVAEMEMRSGLNWRSLKDTAISTVMNTVTPAPVSAPTMRVQGLAEVLSKRGRQCKLEAVASVLAIEVISVT